MVHVDYKVQLKLWWTRYTYVQIVDGVVDVVPMHDLHIEVTCANKKNVARVSNTTDINQMYLGYANA